MRIAALLISAAADLLIACCILRLAAGKSLTACVAEGYLYLTGYRKRFADKKRFEQYLAVREKENAAELVLPEKLRFKSPICEEERCGMRVFIFNKGAAGGRILYLHGGAYLNRPQKMHWRFWDRLAVKTGLELVVPMYPLLPQHTGDEVFSAVRDLYLSLAEEGREITLMGDSSGGGLATAVAASGVPAPERILLISPWVDVSLTNPDLREYDNDPLCALYGLRTLGKMWAGWLDISDPKVSPVNADLSGLSNVTVFAGERELLYPDIIRFAEKIPGAELIVGKGVHHDYPLYPTPEAKRAMREIINKF